MRAKIYAAVLTGITFGIAIEPACCCDLCVGLPTVAFVCDPSDRPTDERCPDTHFCCSDDPATADGALPSFTNKGIDGSTPLFAEAANDVGRWGMCSRRDDIPAGSGLEDALAHECPIPCKPTWNHDDVSAVCGPGRICCQTVELDDDDCVRDADTQRWRPADGRDAVESLDGGTRWRPTASSTHQDPDFSLCEAHAGSRDSEAFRECVAQLGTANQRGFCMALAPGQDCPTHPDTGYRSACDRMND